jgi:Protein of unknown function (DUF1488)
MSDNAFFDGMVGVYFGMKDGNKTVRCVVTYEALDDYVRGSPNLKDRLSIFREIRLHVEEIASALYDAGYIEKDGLVIVYTRELNPQLRATAA